MNLEVNYQLSEVIGIVLFTLLISEGVPGRESEMNVWTGANAKSSVQLVYMGRDDIVVQRVES